MGFIVDVVGDFIVEFSEVLSNQIVKFIHDEDTLVYLAEPSILFLNFFLLAVA